MSDETSNEVEVVKRKPGRPKKIVEAIEPKPLVQEDNTLDLGGFSGPFTACESVVVEKVPKIEVTLASESVRLPARSTFWAAMYDLEAHITMEMKYLAGYGASNVKINVPVRNINGDVCITIQPGERVLIPTGLTMAIEEGYSLRIFSRSGMTLKSGIVAANGVGVIDCDYRDEVYVILTNVSDRKVVISNGMRVAQCEVIKDSLVTWEVVDTLPVAGSDRIGGLGSTGTH